MDSQQTRDPRESMADETARLSGHAVVVIELEVCLCLGQSALTESGEKVPPCLGRGHTRTRTRQMGQ
jgi:hypothetical protein